MPQQGVGRFQYPVVLVREIQELAWNAATLRGVLRKGSDVVRIDCYLHTSDHAPQGWYPPASRTATLRAPFQR